MLHNDYCNRVYACISKAVMVVIDGIKIVGDAIELMPLLEGSQSEVYGSIQPSSQEHITLKH